MDLDPAQQEMLPATEPDTQVQSPTEFETQEDLQSSADESFPFPHEVQEEEQQEEQQQEEPPQQPEHMENVNIESGGMLQVEIMNDSDFVVGAVDEVNVANGGDEDNTILLPAVETNGTLQSDELQTDVLAMDDPIESTDANSEKLEVQPLIADVIPEKRRGRPRGPRVELVLEEELEEEDESLSSRNRNKTQPTSSKRGRPPLFKPVELDKIKMEDTDEILEVQCRICLTTTSNLVSIFRRDGPHTVNQKIAAICPDVVIVKHDCLPQYICATCLESVNIAFNLKTVCESTDKEIRDRAVQGKSNSRKSRKAIKIEPDSDFSEEQADDDEFKLSDAAPESAIESSGSDSDEGKRRPTRGRRRKPRKMKDYSSGSGENFSSPKKKFKSDGDGSFTCSLCPEPRTFATKKSLARHRTIHTNEGVTCELCSRNFKNKGALKMHMVKHKDDTDLKCPQCNKMFTNKSDKKRHMIEIHNEPLASHVCDKCKRAFTTPIRLERHKEAHCPGFEVTHRRKKEKNDPDAGAGKNLFQCVAPLTTTYWSDSFSE